jgi:WD40 repeat protein
MFLRGTIPEPIAEGRVSRLLAIMSGVFLAGVAGMTGGALLGIGLVLVCYVLAGPESGSWVVVVAFFNPPLIGAGLGLIAGGYQGGTRALGRMNQQRWWPLVLGIGWPAFLIALSNLPPGVVVFDLGLLMLVFWPFALFVIIASLHELYVRRARSVFVWAPFGLIAAYLLLGVFTWAWNLNRAAKSRAMEEERLNIERAEAAAARAAAARTFPIEHRTLRGHTARVTSISFNSEGTRIVSGSSDKLAKIWDAGTGRHIMTLSGHGGGINGVAMSPDGKRIVTASQDATLKVWDASSGAEVQTLKGHVGPVLCAAYSPDGTRIVSGGADYTLRYWDAATGKETNRRSHQDERIAEFRRPPGVRCVAFSADGKRLAVGNGDGMVEMLDAVNGQLTRSLLAGLQPVQTLAFSPDAKRMIAGNNYAWSIWDVASGDNLGRRPDYMESAPSVAFSPDGKWIVGNGARGDLNVWDASSFSRIRILPDVGEVTSIAFSRDGKRMASGSEENVVTVWDISPSGEN